MCFEASFLVVFKAVGKEFLLPLEPPTGFFCYQIYENTNFQTSIKCVLIFNIFFYFYFFQKAEPNYCIFLFSYIYLRGYSICIQLKLYYIFFWIGSLKSTSIAYIICLLFFFFSWSKNNLLAILNDFFYLAHVRSYMHYLW